MATFEDRLLDELKSELPCWSEPRRRRWPAMAAAVVAAGTAVVTVASVAAVPPAYAIEDEADGTLVITINSLDPGDIARAEADLRRRGVRIELVAASHDCLGVLGAGRVVPPHPLPSGPPSADQHPALYAFDPTAGDDRFVVRPGVIPAGQVLWVAIADNGTNLATVAGFEPAGAPQPDFCA